ncbi:MAG: Maf-like protein [Geminicoccaceae bacterium]|nr:Maf-like protein [Geminicoccaceae bacterium]
MTSDTPPIVLASASAARARLLRAAGVAVTLQPARIDEAAVKEALAAEGASAEDAAVAIAEFKGRAVAARVPAGAIVLAADQLLEAEGTWFDKPRDTAEALAHLMRLSGRRHDLIAAAVGFRGGARVWHQVSRARLWMRPFDEAFARAYLEAAGPDVLACVGCYEIEGLGAQLMNRIEGDLFTVQGLPLLPVLQFLRDQGALQAPMRCT